jgi:cytochrome c-type biogenesis protein CcmE
MEPSTLDKIVPEPRRLTRLALTTVVAVAAVGFFTHDWGKRAVYKMVDEVGDLAQWDGAAMKLHGYVTAGSIVETQVGGETICTFELQRKTKRIRAFAAGPKPDHFQDESEVVINGHVTAAAEKQLAASELGVQLDTEYVFDATDVMMKCGGKYDGAPRHEPVFF